MLMGVLFLPSAGCQYVEKLMHTPDSGRESLVFTSFSAGEERSLFLLYSRNGYAWERIGVAFTLPEIGFRDPAIARGPDGVYHVVWTSSRPASIAYSSSRDLIQWSHPRALPVMQSEPDCRNAWAPELFFDELAGEWLIIWSSTVSGRFPETIGGDGWNNRLYYCTTKDFQKLSPPQLFFDPGYACIDGAILKRGLRYYLVYKNESVIPASHRQDEKSGEPAAPLYHDYIEIAVSDSPRGPWTGISRPLDIQSVEAPAPIEIDGRVFVYYDLWSRGKYGGMVSDDMIDWQDKTTAMTFPENHRHGTPIHVPTETLERLLTHHGLSDTGAVTRSEGQ